MLHSSAPYQDPALINPEREPPGVNASPKGSPVLGPCYLPALPQATPFPEPGAPRSTMKVSWCRPPADTNTFIYDGKDIFPSPPKGAPIDH